MIIARGQLEGKELLIFGLSHKNINELLKDRPLFIRREVHGEGVPAGWQIVILAGETEEKIAQQLKDAGALKPDTIIHENPNL